jgi:CDGSH-type Zn-finger protein
MFFTAAKQSATVAARIDKFTPRILRRKGMNDCVCGHSQKMPGCDGSHKLFPGSVTC